VRRKDEVEAQSRSGAGQMDFLRSHQYSLCSRSTGMTGFLATFSKYIDKRIRKSSAFEQACRGQAFNGINDTAYPGREWQSDKCWDHKRRVIS
jgi:hypothetical protein